MNKIFIKTFCFSLVLFANLSPAINFLKIVEVCKNRFAPNLFLEFTNSVYFEKRVNKQKMQLELAFLAMDLKNFRDQNIVEQIMSMGKIVKNVNLYHTNVPSPRVVVLITFAVNDILVRWNKLEDPARLVIDFFRKRDLDLLQNKGRTILHASNMMSSAKKKRILIDAGHGGLDPGALGFFLLKEKNLTLDIARRVQNVLKKNGYNVFLTRSKDKALSLKQRSELAAQMRADFFISIHANAVSSVSGASGVESYFLNPNLFLPGKRRGGFLFVFNQNDKNIAKFVDTILKDNIDSSQKLASNIQNGIIDFLNRNKIDVMDRGIKRNDFSVLLRSEVPAALIEVGFITNKIEAKRLSESVYRQMIAVGISNGIKKYIENMSL